MAERGAQTGERFVAEFQIAAGDEAEALARAEECVAPAVEPTALILPGLHGSGPAHWQSHWERRHPRFQRVEQESWTRPELGDWAAALDRAVRAAPGPVVLVAHSLGCALVAHWARAGLTGRVRGALLVAPADIELLAPLLGLRSFSPMPREPLPFPSRVVASANDPFVSLAQAKAFAQAWGSRIDDVGPQGHLNVESGHGPWPEGERLLEALLADPVTAGRSLRRIG